MVIVGSAKTSAKTERDLGVKKMLTKWNETQQILKAHQVNLSEVKSAFMYLGSGFSLSNSFQIVTKRGVGALSKASLSKLKAVVLRVTNDSKTKFRLLIPVLLPVLVLFSLGESKDNIKVYLSDVLAGSVTGEDLSKTLDVLRGSMKERFYEAELNSELDPFAGMFGGKAPKSFTNAVKELTDKLSVLENKRPVLREVGPQTKQTDPSREISIKQRPPLREVPTKTAQSQDAAQPQNTQASIPAEEESVDTTPTTKQKSVSLGLVVGSFIVNAGLFYFCKYKR